MKKGWKEGREVGWMKEEEGMEEHRGKTELKKIVKMIKAKSAKK